ncbi:OsmC family protein [Kiloniella sp. b19]|uniref:OsmC family protein n=1 Tax=Kiloniella sp. GXU_MW_B19 TaxID=3141326 RepID=UPI0031DB85BA
MKTRIKWVEQKAFLAESGSGHAVLMDGAPDAGGRNMGPRPMEMLLMGLGGCASFDVVFILERGRKTVEDVECEITAERADTDPKVFTGIHLHFKVKGAELSEDVVGRAIELSAEKYCSASIMLGKSAKLTHSFEMVS